MRPSAGCHLLDRRKMWRNELIRFAKGYIAKRIEVDCGTAMNCDIRIGTSGWHYQHWRGPFYDAKCPSTKMLDFYCRHFDTVEINNTFYRLPSAEMLRTWRGSTPENFCFAVKASRFITHNKKLNSPENALEKFFPPIEELREKMGPILFQLPPKWRVNAERLEEFLAKLGSHAKRRYTFEFRELSWLNEEVYDILRKYNAAFCIYDLAGFATPRVISADWAYIRLHGPDGKYQGRYSKAILSNWADWIFERAQTLRAIYVYFDNDQAGHAAQNAMELKELVKHYAEKERRIA